jgi:hypothetical protein
MMEKDVDSSFEGVRARFSLPYVEAVWDNGEKRGLTPNHSKGQFSG